MEYREKEKICRRISIGKLIENIDNKIITFKDPDQAVLLEADAIYDFHYNKNSFELKTFNDILDSLKEKGQWSDQKEKEIEILLVHIKAMKADIDNCKYLEKKKKALIGALKEAEKRLENLYKLKYSLYDISREHFCEKQRRYYIIDKICSINIADHNLKEMLCKLYFEDNHIDDKKIREVARTNPWRIAWNTSKELSIPLFDTTASNMTSYQQSLVTWSFIYDFAFNNQNKPSDSVIQDDDLFDAWYELEISGKNKTNESIKKQNNTGYAGQEILVMADKEGAKKVYEELNDQDAKNRIKQRAKIIKEKGIVSDTDFTDVRKDIKMEANRKLYAK